MCVVQMLVVVNSYYSIKVTYFSLPWWKGPMLLFDQPEQCCSILRQEFEILKGKMISNHSIKNY